MAEPCVVTVAYIANFQNAFNEFVDHFYRDRILRTAIKLSLSLQKKKKLLRVGAAVKWYNACLVFVKLYVQSPVLTKISK